MLSVFRVQNKNDGIYKTLLYRLNISLKVERLFLTRYIFSHYDSLDHVFHKLPSSGPDLIENSLGTLHMTKFIKLHALKTLVISEV